MITTEDGALISRPVWADFQGRDWKDRVRLDLPGTQRDLAEHGAELTAGLRVVLFDEDADTEGKVDDLVVVGEIEFDEGERRWVARVDWAQVTHVSRLTEGEADAYRRYRPQSVGRV